MAMSQLSGRRSLRDIQSNLEALQHKLYHLGAQPITRTTLARLNERQPAELYEALLYKLLGRCKNHPGKHKFRFKNPLYSLDASALDLSLKLFPWAAHRDHAANVKLSVELNHSTDIPEFVALSDGNENDMVEGRKFSFPKGSIVAFDKSYMDYQWFGNLTKQGVSFVTRLRTKAVFRVLERKPVDKQTSVTSDQIIELSSAHAIKAPRLRRIGYRDPETSKRYEFLTNNLRLSAATITAIYIDRWKVELFFKPLRKPKDQSLRRHIKERRSDADMDCSDHLLTGGVCAPKLRLAKFGAKKRWHIATAFLFQLESTKSTLVAARHRVRVFRTELGAPL